MKKIFVSLIALLVSVNIFASDIHLINFQNIKKLSEYEDKIEFIFQNLDYLSAWVPDDYWHCELSKDELRTQIKEIYKTVSKKSESKNQDYLLLKGIISSYLYNLDEPKSFDQTVKDFNAVEKLKEYDYRYKWFLANFYTQAALPFKAYTEYQYVTEKIPEDKLHPEFFYNKAYFEYVNGMFENAICDYEKYSKYSGESLDSVQLYQTLKKLRANPKDDDPLDYKKIWKFQKREDGVGYYSARNGLWIPVSKKWENLCVEWHDQVIYDLLAFKFTCYDKKLSDNVSFTIMILPERKEFEESLADIFNSPKINLGFEEGFTTYDASSPEQYPHLGGSLSYVTFCSRDFNLADTLSLEKPINLTNENGGLMYYTQTPYYPRENEKINYCILLDSCQDLKNESLEIYLDFVNNLIIK